MIKRFIQWLFSFFPNKTTPQFPVINIPASKPKKTGKYEPIKGCDWNPFLKYPRNELCYCGSEKKYKLCCIKTDLLAIDSSVAKKAKPLVKKLRDKKIGR